MGQSKDTKEINDSVITLMSKTESTWEKII